jgi:hypothetical protein
VARLHRWPLDAEFLTIDSAVQCIEVERVVREYRQRGDGIADAVVGLVQRCVAQVLLIGALQTWYGISLVRAMTRLPWFIACAMMTAIRLSVSATFLA